MQSSPSKRRKTSPTTSIRVDAPPATPSRIPVRKNAGKSPGRPSFASPTKASISRHNPQLLRAPPSTGRRGRNLDDIFARALGEAQKSNEKGEDEGTEGSTTQENDPPEERPPQNSQSVGRGGMSANPRRLSRSPFKPSKQYETLVAGVEQGNKNPFKKTGLRRSPPNASQASQEQPVVQEYDNPFIKKGLRRSPISSQPQEVLRQSSPQPQVSTTPSDPLHPRAVDVAFRVSLPESEAEPDEPQESIPERIDSQNIGHVQSSPSQRRALKTPQASQIPSSPPRELETTKAPEVIVSASPIRRQTQQETETLRASPIEVSPEPPSELPKSDPPQPKLAPPASLDAENNLDSRATQADDLPTFTSSKAPPDIRSSKPWSPITFDPRRPLDSHKVLQDQLRSTRVAGSTPRLHPTEHEEPELPPTPTERGIPDPVVTTPPRGIHDTPSKRARRNKALGQKFKSSPLKPRDPAPEKPSSYTKAGPERKELFKPRRSARFTVLEDPHASKKKARSEMLKELQQLQADVALTSQENERLRLHFESNRAPPEGSKNRVELESALLRSLVPERPLEAAPKPKSIFKSIGSFLPFSARRKIRPALPDLEKPIPTHLPVPVDDPLPYLQAFSSLTYTSNIILLPSEIAESEEVNRPVMQQHLINASHPSGLFNARLSMVVDSSILAVSSLEIQNIDPSAESELGRFIRERALKKDIGIVCWAMGRWTEISILRAKLWCSIVHELSTPETRAKSLQPTKKRKRQTDSVNEEDSILADDDETRQVKWTRSQLLPFIGKSAVELGTDEVELRFEWKIGFDWTGEVDSTISASSRLPESWQESDTRNSLRKVPESFDRLVKQKGPLGAVRTIVGLLMPTTG